MNESRIRVIVVDDHSMVLDAMVAGLAAQDAIEIVGQAGSYQEALDLLSMRPTDLIVTDFELGDGRGTDLAAYAAHLQPPVPVLLITGTDERKGVDAALSSGCNGFVSKAQGFDELVHAVLAVARGAAVFPASLLSQALHDEPAAATALSPRELEVLQRLANARSVGEISEEMHLSVHTVRNHVKQVLAKLGARSQLEAVVIAARRGFVAIT